MGWTTHTSNCHTSQINRKKRATVVQDPTNYHHASGVFFLVMPKERLAHEPDTHPS